MKTSEYTPHPIDMSDVKLPADLEMRIEEIARNVHEVWAQSRLDQGWTLGDKRYDALNTHPCLVPYEELPEQEKDYDRDTVMGTIKMLLKLGYNITK